MLEAHAAERMGAAVTYGSGFAAVFFGLTASEFAALIAAGVCVMSYLTTHGISAYFKYQELSILRETNTRHARMEREKLDAEKAAIERNTLMVLPVSEACENCSVCRK